MKIYIASRYSRHPEMQEHARALEAAGHSVTSRWIRGGHELHEDANTDEQRANFAIEDIEDLTKADCVLSFTETGKLRKGQAPSKGGRHVEFGVGLALNKLLAIVGPRENVFHWLPNVDVYEDLESFIRTLDNEEN